MRNILKRKMFFIGVIISVMLCTSVIATAEGSYELVKDGGYRTFLEWDTNLNTVGVQRNSKLKAYAKKGETISFGSSVLTALDGKDIVVRTPDGKETVYDVTEDRGFIDTVVKEKNGPFPENGGYTPIEITADKEGIYEFEFHSPCKTNTNPKKILASRLDTDALKQGSGVGAWDITVKNNGQAVTGRVFANYLALNTGFNSKTESVIKSKIFVLTKEGYQYKINFNGIDPYGFILYANNRGLIDMTSNEAFYGNAKGTHKIVAGMLDEIYGNIAVQVPMDYDTSTNITHRIFLNQPSEDLPSDMPTQPVSPARVESFTFEGTESGKTATGNGGIFHTSFEYATSYEIMIDVNNNGVYDGDDVILSDAAAEGDNVIVWDGCDASGKALKSGEYTARVMTRNGECHFPLLDVENNKNGLCIEMLNAPESAVSFNPTTVYYNNSSYTTANGENINMEAESSDAPKPVSALSGVDSTNGAMKFKGNYGDEKVMQFWSYYPGEEQAITIEVIDDEKEYSVISGFVFWDENENGEFDVSEMMIGDAGLNVDVNIVGKDTDSATRTVNTLGKYSEMIPMGKYTVTANIPDGYVCTTKNGFEVSAESGVTYVPVIGIYRGTPVTTPIPIPTVEPTITPIPTETPDILIPPNPVPGPDESENLKNDYAYIFGYTDDTMAPEESIKRGEASALMHRLLKQNDLVIGYEKPLSPTFIDCTQARWDYTAIEYMTYIGVYNKDYSEKQISPDTPITRGEAAKIFAFAIGLVETDDICDFADVDKSNPYYEYINSLYAKGYVEGSDGYFHPDDRITRAEFVTIYNKIIERDDRYDYTTDVQGKAVKCEFNDMNENQWYYGEMMKGTNAFTDFYVDLEKRGIRNNLDEYDQ